MARGVVKRDVAAEFISISEDQVSAFWSKVDVRSSKECWPWLGAQKTTGYGNVRIEKRYLSAHRVAYMLSNGPILSSHRVCHTCDNPACCNPKHLMLGTAGANSMDMALKGRGKKPHTAARGAKNGNSKLSEETVIEIRKLYASGIARQREIGAIYGISPTLVGQIVRRQIWVHV